MSEESQNILGGESPVQQNPVADPASQQTSVPPAQDPAAFDWSKLAGENGALADNWRDALPEDLRNEHCLDSIHNFTALVKSYTSAQKMVGQNKIAIPGKDATDAERADFFAALGRPESADKYTLDGVELPDGIVIDDGLAAEFRQKAFDLGLNQETFSALLNYDVQRLAGNMQQQQQAAAKEYNETLARLRSEYGSDLPQVIAQCDKALNAFGLKKLFEDKGLLNNYDAFKALELIGKSISEAKLKPGEATVTTRDPAAELAQLQSDLAGALYNREHPGHDAAVEKQNSLLREIAARQNQQ